jgi:Chromate transporter
MSEAPEAERVPLSVIARQWLRLGCIGAGGPPAHIALLRKLVVQDRKWLAADGFEDGVAAVSLLPGPASTQLTIYAAWRLRGAAGGRLALSGRCGRGRRRLADRAAARGGARHRGRGRPRCARLPGGRGPSE